MASIPAVNPAILSEAGIDAGAVFTATALASIIAIASVHASSAAAQFGALLHQKLGIKVPGTVSIDNSFDILTCISKMAPLPHQWSLVSTECNAVIIATTMAASYGKVAIDFGHAPDYLISPDTGYWLAAD